ncbi:hypothetical protein SB861_10070, partial [Paraburkholderia sp. SIMBA_049]
MILLLLLLLLLPCGLLVFFFCFEKPIFFRSAFAFWGCLRRWVVRFGFALASAFCLRASSVAPVRGGTYFSLPPQRKVG